MADGSCDKNGNNDDDGNSSSLTNENTAASARPPKTAKTSKFIKLFMCCLRRAAVRSFLRPR